MLTGKRRGPAPTGKGVQVVARMQPDALAALDAWIARQPKPRPSRPEALRKLAELGLAADRDARLNPASAEIEKVAAERARRLAKAVRGGDVSALDALPATPTTSRDAVPTKKIAGAMRAKELAVGAVKQALAKVDAPDEEKMERKRKLVAPPATGKISKPAGRKDAL